MSKSPSSTRTSTDSRNSPTGISRDSSSNSNTKESIRQPVKEEISTSNQREIAVDAFGRNAYDQALRLKINDKFRLPCRIVCPNTKSWIYSVAAASDYSPVELLKDGSELELRMRIIGVSAGSGKKLNIFDCEVGHELHHIETKNHKNCVINTVSISKPLGKYSPLLAIGTNEGRVYIYDLMSGIQLYEKISLKNHGSSISSVLIHEQTNRNVLLVASDLNLYIWEFENCHLQIIINDFVSNIMTTSIISNPKSKTISDSSMIVSGDSNGNIYFHNFFTGNLIHYWNGQNNSTIFSITNCSFLSKRYVISAGIDSIIRIWNMNDYSLINELTDHIGAVHSVAVITGNNYPAIISGGHDCDIRIWNLLTCELLAKLIGHKDPIRSLCVCCIPHMMIVSGSYDDTTRVWDLEMFDNDNIRLLPQMIGVNVKSIDNKNESDEEDENSDNVDDFKH